MIAWAGPPGGEPEIAVAVLVEAQPGVGTEATGNSEAGPIAPLHDRHGHGGRRDAADHVIGATACAPADAVRGLRSRLSLACGAVTGPDEPVIYRGRYALQQSIGKGGMAEVFLAQDQLLDRPVAIKRLSGEHAGDPSFVERFRREAQAAAKLSHPNIVGVFDYFEEGDEYFIVQEYIDGRSLAELLRAEGRLHPDRAADIAADIAAGLGAAHREGMVHRDVKAGNVLVATDGQVKVADFGIARVFAGGDSELTQAGTVMGTATYFSPEQAQGKPVDPRSDLYSLGVVLYEMLVGRARRSPATSPWRSPTPTSTRRPSGCGRSTPSCPWRSTRSP